MLHAWFCSGFGASWTATGSKPAAPSEEEAAVVTGLRTPVYAGCEMARNINPSNAGGPEIFGVVYFVKVKVISFPLCALL